MMSVAAGTGRASTRRDARVGPETIRAALGARAKAETVARRGDGDRTAAFEATLRRIEPVMRLAGITRVSDIGGLDTTGVPAFQCVRPGAEWGDQTFTVFGGKGETELQCKVSAIAEAIERFCAETRNGRELIVTASYSRLSREHSVIHPKRFNTPASQLFDEDTVTEWVRAESLLDGHPHYVPACAVFYPYEPGEGPASFRYFTTGLAAGASYEEAISHGLAEMIERDAAALNRIVRDRPAVDLKTVDSVRAQNLISKYLDADVTVVIRDITAPDIGIPAFSVLLEDQLNQDPLFVSGGYGAHPDKERALLSALTEAGLSRTGTISGAREDLAKFALAKGNQDYAAFRHRYRYWFSTEPSIDYRSIASVSQATAIEDITLMAERVWSSGLPEVLWVDLSKPELVLPVVKVLAPGIERYSFKMTCIGDRAKKFYRERYRRELQT